MTLAHADVRLCSDRRRATGRTLHGRSACHGACQCSRNASNVGSCSATARSRQGRRCWPCIRRTFAAPARMVPADRLARQIFETDSHLHCNRSLHLRLLMVRRRVELVDVARHDLGLKQNAVRFLDNMSNDPLKRLIAAVDQDLADRRPHGTCKKRRCFASIFPSFQA